MAVVAFIDIYSIVNPLASLYFLPRKAPAPSITGQLYLLFKLRIYMRICGCRERLIGYPARNVELLCQVWDPIQGR
jgi:hypothetical protein